MADQKKTGEFLGGGPKFNAVGRDNRSAAGAEEPVVPVDQTGYRLRLVLIGVVIVTLAATLFFLNGHAPGSTIVAPSRAGASASPDAPKKPTDSDFK